MKSSKQDFLGRITTISIYCQSYCDMFHNINGLIPEKMCQPFPFGNLHTSDAVPCREITDIGTGTTPSRSEPTFWTNGTIPWITSGSTSQSVIKQGDELVTPAAVKVHRFRIYQPKTLLVALYGQGKTRGQVRYCRFNQSSLFCHLSYWRRAVYTLLSQASSWKAIWCVSAGVKVV